LSIYVGAGLQQMEVVVRLLVLVLVAKGRSGMRLGDVQQLVQQQVRLFCRCAVMELLPC
jgi:hypothetical protein